VPPMLLAGAELLFVSRWFNPIAIWETAIE
jgi:hypothetical protein